jgi:hypothetical protein
MTSDWIVVATTAITGAGAVGGAWIGLLAGRQQIKAEDSRQRWLKAQARRDERKQVYGVAINLITDWYWDSNHPPPDYDVINVFTKPFVHAAAAVRVYGSDQASAAIDRFQEALIRMNQLNDTPNCSGEEAESIRGEIFAALDEFFIAARADVGPVTEDFRWRPVDQEPMRRHKGPVWPDAEPAR